MIPQSILLEKLTDLGANFSKALSKAQVKLIIKIVDYSDMSEMEFCKKIDNFMKDDYFPRNLSLAFNSSGLKKCKIDGCKLRGIIITDIRRCGFHDDVEAGSKKNTMDGFDLWKIEQIDKIKNCPHNYSDNAIEYIEKWTWADVSYRGGDLNFGTG